MVYSQEAGLSSLDCYTMLKHLHFYQKPIAYLFFPGYAVDVRPLYTPFTHTLNTEHLIE